MNLTWEKSVQTCCPRETVYAYLADFDRHREWATSLARMEKIADGDEHGIGRRYMTYEKLEFADEGSWKKRLPGTSSTRTTCEIRELVPGKRIAWHARPVPGFLGRADLVFEFEDVEGGTLVKQRVVELYPRPVAFVMKTVFSVTEDGIRDQLDRTLEGLKVVLDAQHVPGVDQPAAAGS